MTFGRRCTLYNWRLVLLMGEPLRCQWRLLSMRSIEALQSSIVTPINGGNTEAVLEE
jgi:hypothetical protein